jgi:hypothetical protein
MKPALSLLAILLALSPWSSIVMSAEKITEEYVVKILDGEDKSVVSVKPPGFAFTVVFPSSTVGSPYAQGGGVDRGTVPHDQFYRRLVPLGRALESEVLQGYRFLVTVNADSHAPTDHIGMASVKVAEEIKRFLTANFAIASERLSIKGTEAAAPGTVHRPPSEGTQRWRVEVIRVE